MTPMEAIRTATVNAADLLEKRDTLGRIAAGQLADIVATSGNPLEDISALAEVDFVMRDGKIFKGGK